MQYTEIPLSEVEPGQKVFYHFSYHSFPEARVAIRTTKERIILSEYLVFNRKGKQLGVGRDWISPWSPEREAEIEQSKQQERIKNQVVGYNFRKMSPANLERVLLIIEEEKVAKE